MKNIGKLLIIMFCLGITSCRTPQPPVDLLPPPPSKVESSLPLVGGTLDTVSDILAENNKLAKALESQKKTILDQRMSVETALAEAQKMKERAIAKELISEIDAINLENALKEIGSRNMFLEKENTELKEIQDTQNNLLNETRKQLDIVTEAVAKKESEADNLRRLYEFAEANAKSSAAEAEALTKKLDKAQSLADKANVYRKWVIGLVIGYIVLGVLRNVLLAYGVNIRV
jgi:hypothetical protein